jgi:outer membrane protein TolC
MEDAMFLLILRIYGKQLRFMVITVAGFLSVPGDSHADDKDSKVKALLKDRLAVLQEVVTLQSASYSSGGVTFLELLEAKQSAYKAELDLCETDAERIAVLENRLAIAKQQVETLKRLVSAAEVDRTDLLKAEAKRLKIEVALERLKGKIITNL